MTVDCGVCVVEIFKAGVLDLWDGGASRVCGVGTRVPIEDVFSPLRLGLGSEPPGDEAGWSDHVYRSGCPLPHSTWARAVLILPFGLTSSPQYSQIISVSMKSSMIISPSIVITDNRAWITPGG